MKIRLDDLLVQRNLAESKAKAQALIMSGKVFSGTQRLDKAGKKVDADLDVTVEAPPRFVSRGGEKLQAMLEALENRESRIENGSGDDVLARNSNFSFVKDSLCLDVGASTGGFTDCLLQHGAKEVICVDVGHGQLHPKIKNEPRVKNFEGINAREMKHGQLPYAQYDIVVMDLAFISQKKVLENVWNFVKNGGLLISLIKPQFEITKQEADKCQGVVKDEAIRARVVEEVRNFAKEKLSGCIEERFTNSPIEGAEGNKEYLVAWRKNG